MNKSLSNLLTAVVTAISVLAATMFFTGSVETVEQGQDAALERRVKEIIEDETEVAINGDTKSLSEALSMILSNQNEMSKELAVATQQLDALTE